MKVCLANDSFPPLLDGVSNTVVNYAAIIEQKYGSAIVATPRYPGVKDNYPFEVVRYASFNTTKMVGYRAGYPFSHNAMRRLEAFGPDIIHSHCPMASNFLCRELRSITGVPLVFTYHTKFDTDIKRAIKLKFIHEPAIREVVRSIEAADEVWVVNRGAGENLRSLGYSGDYIVMPNGVDIDKSPADPEIIDRINRKHRIPEGVPVFLFVGRVIWYKGLRIILDGLRGLKDMGQNFRMIIVGKGDDLEDVKNYTKDKGIFEDCIFTGAIYDRAELKAYYSRADLFLLPSVFDNNPLVVKEAAACRTPSVLIRGSSAAEGVVDGYNGVLISESAGDMTRALAALCADREKIRQLGERAAEDLYISWEDSVAHAVARYQQVLENHKAGKIQHPRVKYDRMIDMIGSTYKALVRARLVSEGVAEQFKEVPGEFGAWVRKLYGNIKDRFDRYQ
ncbi:MAG: glycosyltransferase family 4 protein [Clostridiales bacterium]|nr:glycosyltransferase family 4 protein [Clostridiales bacterium]